MDNALKFREKIKNNGYCLGCSITFCDPAVSEALSTVMDFFWIDMEHTPLTIRDVQSHIMATKGTDTATIVRVPSGDAVWLKPVLDCGADGVIIPNVQTAEEARRAVDACLYPPLGKRGYGPRRPGMYGRREGPGYCDSANEAVMVIPQIESQVGVDNLDEILKVPGLASVCFGPMDMSGTMGVMGQGDHPKVVKAIEQCIPKIQAAGLLVGFGTGIDAKAATEWLGKGVQWLQIHNDWGHLLKCADDITAEINRLMKNSPKK